MLAIKKAEREEKSKFIRQWIALRTQHYGSKKARENLKLRLKAKDDAFKIFYATLKLLKVWGKYIHRFGFPKSVRDHRYAKQ